MNKPLLQIAMDNLELTSALSILEDVGEIVDIIEVGTILLLAEGKKSISIIKEKYKNKLILGDAKIADAGNILAKMLFEQKADIITIICCADIATIQGVINETKKFNKELQIELTGYWTFEQAIEWKKIGVEQVVYHRSRDSQASGRTWQKSDIKKIKKLCDLGFKVTITGGVEISDLDLFKHLPIYIIIAGRAIRNSKNPRQAALLFQEALEEKWKS
ncbi:3-keto-L-gulonate-6-phosphate decarboxylase UlaD [Spiroplasma endosymbiont of Aspidapion aeneum]|uniref:3-keto-L-gulonate-6-phosphate decarboxylase UlaD n=1 Tax=Spiroplasma endosymbiont of Aspidapion aeneum TaxID=3066276 RepID=UPI00313E8925